jgi:acyl phosphate:glycerol-3-phosphate acyltransferase
MSGTSSIIAESYLLGSIPFGYLLVRIFHGEDVRQSGSGNIGATNVSRKSPVLGLLTLVLDALKGSAAVLLAFHLVCSTNLSLRPHSAMATAALVSVAGHIFPVWLKFRGGKGVATALGSFLVITPKSALIAAGIFVVVVAVSRYVSLGSIVAVGLFPLLVVKQTLAEGDATSLALISCTSMFIVVRHHENIRRLFTGTENRLGAKRA